MSVHRSVVVWTGRLPAGPMMRGARQGDNGVSPSRVSSGFSRAAAGGGRPATACQRIERILELSEGGVEATLPDHPAVLGTAPMHRRRVRPDRREDRPLAGTLPGRRRQGTAIGLPPRPNPPLA